MADKDLLYEKEGKLAIITLNRPDKMNAFTEDMTIGIEDAVEDAGRDPQVGAIILTAVGDRAFSVGADMSHMGGEHEQRAGRYTVEGWVRQGMGKRHPVLFLYDVEKPTFAAVNGVALGPALGLALSCDFRIASDKARFGTIYALRGLVNDYTVSWHLPRIVGVPKALELMLSGEIIDAQEAERIGLVTKVVPHEKLMETTKEMAGKLAKGPPIALALIKRELRHSLRVDHPATQLDYESYCQSWTNQTEDRREGISAFREKREPQFKGR